MMTCVPCILSIKEDLSLYGAIVEVKQKKVSVSGQPAKRKWDEISTRRQDKEDEVEDVYQDLRHKHAS